MFYNTECDNQQETAKGGMTGLQSGNIYWNDYSWKKNVTLKLEMFTVSVRNTGCKRKTKPKVNISVCSLKHEVNVKVTKFCVCLEALINAYKSTK